MSPFEPWTCLDCGSEMHVHVVPSLVDMPRAQVFRGTVVLAPDDSAVKAYLKVKKILPFATHFSLAALEAQHLKGLREWDLGSFYDVEVERIEAECEHNGVNVSFQEELP